MTMVTLRVIVVLHHTQCDGHVARDSCTAFAYAVRWSRKGGENSHPADEYIIYIASGGGVVLAATDYREDFVVTVGGYQVVRRSCFANPNRN